MSRAAALALALACSTAVAAPAPSVVQQATASVFRVLSRRCSAAERSLPDHLATGFAVKVNGQVRLITALHAVAGCSEIEIQYRGQPYSSGVEKVLRATDLALLSPAPGLQVPALPYTAATLAPGTETEAIGYNSTPTVNPTHVRLRSAGADKLAGLIKDAEILSALSSQGFPALQEKIININSPLTPGDSGAPILDDAGAVAGIVNGNLMRGTFPVSWAFPAASIPRLLSSTEPAPGAASLSNILVAEEVAPNGGPPSGARRRTITCGARTFSFRGSQTFERIQRTADAFAQTHIQMVQQFAAQNQIAIDPQSRFDVYSDSDSGANFAVPEGFKLVGGSDCLATDPASELEMRIHTDAVLDFFQTGVYANGFAQRMARPGETSLPNPLYSTMVFPRVDGMQIQRYAFYYGWYGQPPPYNEGYITLAWRRGTLLEASMRTLIPAPAARGNPRAFPVIAAIYAASFNFE
jgi:trypsin-like peptidase